MFKRLFDFLARIFRIKKCFYINSNNILPAPLDEETERKLLLQVRTGDMEARDTLIIHNLRLVVYIAKKFESTKINIEDLISIGSMGLIKAVQTFKIEKNIKLATYASRCIENEILMHLRKTIKTRQEVSLDEVLNVDSEGNEMVLADILGSVEEETIEQMTKEEDRRNIIRALNTLKAREREIIEMRFGLANNKAMTQREVAELLGISQSYISRLEKRIIDKMRHIVTSKVEIS
ncbi:MAG TPA: RNA polymerase sporulation sigma factor SigK [Acholeplasmataceae bacterium]|jgi:RNA polymerase sporulation-specific sigma factor|nr:RNA polymerase sporulation sigma factor SigK [Acholeplasmataceae bacterium]